jgi:hypothetical protein
LFAWHFEGLREPIEYWVAYVPTIENAIDCLVMGTAELLDAVF